MNIKRSQLTELIKAVVRESIQERKDKWIQKAVDPEHKGYCTPMTKSTCTPHRKALAKRFKSGDIHDDNVEKDDGGHDRGDRDYNEQVGGGVVAEKAPPGFGPDKEHAAIYNKVLKQYPNEPEKAYATMWKIHKKLSEALAENGVMDEHEDSAHEEEEMKLVKVLKHVANKLEDMHMDECMEDEGMEEEGAMNEKKDKWIGKAVDPEHKGYCTPMTKKTCTPRRKALAMRFKKGLEEVKAMCDEYMDEASYKVVAQTQTQTQKDDQAKKVQVDPKVTEASYKTQGPSYRTFKDSPQLPAAKNNPKTS